MPLFRRLKRLVGSVVARAPFKHKVVGSIPGHPNASTTPLPKVKIKGIFLDTFKKFILGNFGCASCFNLFSFAAGEAGVSIPLSRWVDMRFVLVDYEVLRAEFRAE